MEIIYTLSGDVSRRLLYIQLLLVDYYYIYLKYGNYNFSRGRSDWLTKVRGLTECDDDSVDGDSVYIEVRIYACINKIYMESHITHITLHTVILYF